jgi:ribose transport system permease protein
MAGINSRNIIFKVWFLHGILCGIAGFMITSRVGNASALNATNDYALSTVAAVVIGGASLAGGEGNVPMTVVGVFVIAVIGNIMNLIGLASYPQMIVKGAVIIFAVILKSVSSKSQE